MSDVDTRAVSFLYEDGSRAQKLLYRIASNETAQDVLNQHVSKWSGLYHWPAPSYILEINLSSGTTSAEPYWVRIHEAELVFPSLHATQVTTLRLVRTKDESPPPEFLHRTTPGLSTAPSATPVPLRESALSVPQPSASTSAAQDPPAASTSHLFNPAPDTKVKKEKKAKKEKTQATEALLKGEETPVGAHREIPIDAASSAVPQERSSPNGDAPQQQQPTAQRPAITHSILSGPPPGFPAHVPREASPELDPNRSAAIPLPVIPPRRSNGRFIKNKNNARSQNGSAVVALPTTLPPLVLQPVAPTTQDQQGSPSKKRKNTSSEHKKKKRKCTKSSTNPSAAQEAPVQSRKTAKASSSKVPAKASPPDAASVSLSAELPALEEATSPAFEASASPGANTEATRPQRRVSTTSSSSQDNQNQEPMTPKRTGGHPFQDSAISLTAIGRKCIERDNSLSVSLDNALNEMQRIMELTAARAESPEHAQTEQTVAHSLIPPRVIAPLASSSARAFADQPHSDPEPAATKRRSSIGPASHEEPPSKSQRMDARGELEYGQDDGRYASLAAGNEADEQEEEDNIYEPDEPAEEESPKQVVVPPTEDSTLQISAPKKSRKVRIVPNETRKLRKDRDQSSGSSNALSTAYGTYKYHHFGEHGRFAVYGDWIGQGVKTVSQAKERIEEDTGVEAKDLYILLGPRVLEDGDKIPLRENLDVFLHKNFDTAFWDEPGTNVSCTIGDRGPYTFFVGDSYLTQPAVLLWKKLDEAMEEAKDDLRVSPLSHALTNDEGCVWNNMAIAKTFRNLKTDPTANELALNVVPAEEVAMWVSDGVPGIDNKRIKHMMPMQILLGAAKSLMLKTANLSEAQDKDFFIGKRLLVKDDEPFFALDGTRLNCTVQIHRREKKR